ncbi:MAG: endonuclease domain-containing protein [Limisphaerales bacterium]
MQSSPITRTLRKKATWAEKTLWRWLRGRRFAGYKFRRQHKIEDHILDFFCPEAGLNTELDGGGHGHPEQKDKDAKRDAFLREQGIQVMRIWNHRLVREPEVVRTAIWQALQARSPHPDNQPLV